MKNVGIMTWFTYNNYGTLLQVSALSKIISDMGYNPLVINYIPRIRKTNIFDMNFSYMNNNILEKEKKKKYKCTIENNNKKFEEYRNNKLKFTDIADSHIELKKIAQEMDKIVCGSDQIWSPTVYDSRYYLDFVDDKSKKIAYAPSFGVSTIKSKYIENEIKQLLNEFSSLSVREEAGKKIIKNLIQKDVKIVLDPTLLLDCTEWDKYLNFANEKPNNNKYILCYFLGNNKEYYKLAKKISNQLNIELKIIPTNYKSLNSKIDFADNCGPSEFVKLIKEASYVLTDSYHGMLFSIIYNVQFIILKRFKDNHLSQNSRIYNTLKVLNLTDRLYCKNLDHILNNEINYQKINKKVEELKKESLKYLKEAINKTNSNDAQRTNYITNNCTGCGMCASVCPTNAISIVTNKNGFFEYKIDKKKCINCGLCKKVCAQCQNKLENIKEMNLYSASSNNKEVLLNSSSGGIGYEISQYAIDNNLPIIGCTYNYKKNIAEHILIKNSQDIEKLSGSKYLQSYTVDAFKEIKKLKKGIIIGTPCQIASINNYVSIIKKRDNFILVDLICHGIPSYNLWTRTIDNIKKINNIKFRNKKYGWKCSTKLTINKKLINKKLFYDFFTSGTIYNKCCYSCNYRKSSCADIRIGDYWGNKFKDNKFGISMVIVNTNAGEKVLKELVKQKKISLNKENIEDYFKNQQSINAALPLKYNEVMSKLANMNNSIKKIHKNYIKKIILDLEIRQRLYPIYRKFVKSNEK